MFRLHEKTRTRLEKCFCSLGVWMLELGNPPWKPTYAFKRLDKESLNDSEGRIHLDFDIWDLVLSHASSFTMLV